MNHARHVYFILFRHISKFHFLSTRKSRWSSSSSILYSYAENANFLLQDNLQKLHYSSSVELEKWRHANIHSPSFTGGFNGGPNSSGLGPGLAFNLLGIGRITGEAFKLTELANRAGWVCCPNGVVVLAAGKCVVVCSQAAKCLVVVVVAPGADDTPVPPAGDDPKLGWDWYAYWRKAKGSVVPEGGVDTWPLAVLLALVAFSIWMVLNQLVEANPPPLSSKGGRGSPLADMPMLQFCSVWMVCQSCMVRNWSSSFLMARIHFPVGSVTKH